MKLKNIIPNRFSGRIVRQFGAARLIRNTDGTHELVGGTRNDFAAAKEWVSLFAHDIVFNLARNSATDRRIERKKISPRFRFAW
jgi:hypothetical protein